MSSPQEPLARKPPRTLTSAKWHWFFLGLLFVLTAAAFINAAHDSLINDDKFFLPDTSLDFRSLIRLFHENAWAATGVHSDLYRPLFIVSLTVEAMLHGMRARWFHITNVIVHVATTLFLFELLLRLLRGSAGSVFGTAEPSEPGASILPAFLAALLFGLHPIHTEVVNSVFNRSEMLATVGVLGAIWVVWRWAPTHPVRAWAWAALIYFVALLFRESAAPLPLLLLLVVGSLRPSGGSTWAERRRLLPVLALFVVAAIYLLLRRWALGSPSASFSASHPVVALNGFTRERFGLMLGVLREGLRYIIWPHPLLAVHEPVNRGVGLQSLIFQGLILLSALAARRSAPGFFLGLSFFYLAMLPSTRLPVGGISAALAERYLYLPSVGLALALAWLLRQAAAALDARKWWLSLPVGGVAAIFFILTVMRNAEWQTDQSLWESEARVGSNNSPGWALLALTYHKNGRMADATRICDERLRRSTDLRLYTNCGILYENLGRFEAAEDAYRRAIEFGLGSPGYANLARFHANRGRRKEAEMEYLMAIQLEPDDATQHYRRGQYLLRFSPERTEEAEREFRQALAIQPRYAPARVALTDLLANRPSSSGWPSER